MVYVDIWGLYVEVWVRHAAGKITDQGHAMIRISNGNGNYYYGLYTINPYSLSDTPGLVHKYNSTEDGDDSMISHYADPEYYPDGVVFTVYELNVTDEEEEKLQNNLDYLNSNENETPDYNIFSSNCVDFVTNKINEFTSIEMPNMTMPSSLSQYLYLRYITERIDNSFNNTEVSVKNFYSGYEKDGEFVPYTPESAKSWFGTCFDKIVSDLKKGRDEDKNDGTCLAD